MSLSPVFSSTLNSQVSRPLSLEQPLIVRTFEKGIVEIFLDKTGFLFGILSNPKKGISRKKVTFLPSQPVLPEQVETLRKLLSPNVSFLRLKDSNVIQIEPRLLGGGIQTEPYSKLKTAKELFLKLSTLTKEDIIGIKQAELFDKIEELSKALPGLSNYEDTLPDAWYVAKTLHMAIDVLLMTIWSKGSYEKQNTRYSSEQKKAIFQPINTAREILKAHTFPMKEMTLLSLDFIQTGVLLLPEHSIELKDWKTFIDIGKGLDDTLLSIKLGKNYTRSHIALLIQDYSSRYSGIYSGVSANFYVDSMLARFLQLNKDLQEMELANCLDYLSPKYDFRVGREAYVVYRQLLALDRLNDLSLYEPREDLRDLAFNGICREVIHNKDLRTTAISLLTQISLLSGDTSMREKALKALDQINPNQEKDSFLVAYRKWVTDNLPQGYLDEESVKINQVLEAFKDQRSLNTIKRLSFCAPDEPIPSFLLDEPIPSFLLSEFFSFSHILKKITELGLIEQNSGTYKVSKKTQEKFKKLVPKEIERDEEALLDFARSLYVAWKFDEANLDTIDHEPTIPLHVQSFIENVPKDREIDDQLLMALIIFLNKLGLYHLFVKKDLEKAVNSFKEALSSFDFLSSEAEKNARSSFSLPKIKFLIFLPEKQDIKSFFNIYHLIEQNNPVVDLSGQKLNLHVARFLNALIKICWNTSSLIDNETQALGIEDLKPIDLRLSFNQITCEIAKIIASSLPSSRISSLDLANNRLLSKLVLATPNCEFPL